MPDLSQNTRQDSIAQAKRDSMNQITRQIIHQSEIQKKEKTALDSQKEMFVSSANIQALPSQINAQYVFSIFILSLIALAWIRARQRTQLSLLVGGFYSNKILRQTMREEYLLSGTSSLLLGLNFLLMGGMLVILTAQLGSAKLSGSDTFYLLLFGALAWLMIYAIKLIVITLSKMLFGIPELFQEYRFHVILFGQNLGLVWLPLLIFAAYLPTGCQYFVLIVAWVIGALFLLWRLGRTFILSLSLGVSPFYLFLYLCTLEILPLIVLFKVLVGQVSGLNQ